MGTCLFAKSLLGNGCYTFAYLTIVAQQRVYMPQHKSVESDLLQNQVLFNGTLVITTMA
jgi:hypothetical protein